VAEALDSLEQARQAQQKFDKHNPVQLDLLAQEVDMEIIAHTYDADIHCESCMLDYVRAVPYSEYVFGDYTDDDIRYGHNTQGIIDLSKAVELGIIRDSEGNPIHAMFDNDEWYANNLYEGKKTATLNCSDCGKELDTWEGE
jgi:hypothetical protein